MNYDFDALYAEAAGASFSGGKRRFYDNRVTSVSGNDENGKFTIKATLQGKDDKYSTEIVFDESGGLYDYKCSCGIFVPESGPCKHIVASALAYEDKFPQNSIPAPSAMRERSDTAALSLSSEYSKRRHTRYLCSDDEKVRLIPILIRGEQDRLTLRFNIGRERLYTLKDISDFVSAVNSSAYRRYGVELELDHNIQNFNEESQRLIKFIISSYIEKTEFTQSFGAPTVSYRDELMLTASDVDEFMQMYSGTRVAFEDKSSKNGTRYIDPNENLPNLKLNVEKVNGGFVITSPMPQFFLINGKKSGYFVTNNDIFRASREFITVLSPLLKTLNTHKKIFVADADMPYFYNSVIVSADEFVSVDSGGHDLSYFEASPFVAKLYINSASGGKIKAEVLASYDDEPVNIFDDNFNAPFVRDWDAEREFKKLLSKYFSDYPSLELSQEADIYNFMMQGVSELFNYADIYLEESVKRMRVKKPPRIRVGVRLDSGLLNLDLEAEEYSAAELMQILTAYKEKKNYIRLHDGSFVNLNDQSIEALSDILSVTKADEYGYKLPPYYAPYLNSLLNEGFFHLERDTQFKQLIKNLASARDLDIPVPAELKDVMRNYQKTGFRWLKTLSDYGFGGILADDMGLGKSLQVIALLKSVPDKRSIIVCPTTLMLNWVNEFAKFAPDMKISAIYGSMEERKALAKNIDKADVVITSYELLRRDEGLYKDYKFDFAIVDEAQYIKNPETKNAHAVKSLSAMHRFALTGTPIENSLSELWSIFDFIMPGYLYSYPKFKEKFELGITAGDTDSAEKLRKLVSPFILRRLKSAVLTELPPKVESVVMAAMEGEQKKLYSANLALTRESVLSSGGSTNKVVILSMLTKLRQICCDPRLAYPDYKHNSAKLDMCMEILSEASSSGHKVLLFSQFTSMLELIRKKLDEQNISYYILKGDTPKTERMRLVSRFNSDSTGVFLISLKAGGTGLNLTGADVVIHYDPWWNESVMNQATDRAYRIGQDKSVQVYKLVLENSLEERILKLAEKKSALSSLIVGKGTSPAELIYEDLMAILAD